MRNAIGASASTVKSKILMYRSLGRLSSVSIIVALALSACSSSEVVETSPYNEFIAQTEADALEGGASSAQLDLLHEASDDGEVTLEVARQAARSALNCAIEAGLVAEFNETTGSSGIAVPGFVVVADDGELSETEEATLEHCDDREAFWVNKAYQMQPSSVHLRDRYLESRAPALLKCLEDNGLEVEDESSIQELIDEAILLLDQSSGSIDCFEVSGVDTY